MAGDILLYQTDIVPIGDDQRQHLELARDIAERFNARYGETFVVPRASTRTPGARIMDLQEPSDKMGKTGCSEQGTLRLLDEPDVIRKKLRSAVTDSGRDVRPRTRQARRDQPDRDHVGRDRRAARGDRGALRRRAATGSSSRTSARRWSSCVRPIQERFEELRSDEPELRRMLARGAEKAADGSRADARQMYERMGFVPRIAR